MDSWGKLCRFDSVDSIRPARNTRGNRSSDSELSEADTSASDASSAVTPGTPAATTRYRKKSDQVFFEGKKDGEIIPHSYERGLV